MGGVIASLHHDETLEPSRGIASSSARRVGRDTADLSTGRNR